MSAQDQYQPTEEIGSTPTNNDYTLRRGQANEIPVQRDEAPVESGLGSREEQDSDAQLARDDNEAIDESNILDGGKTRGAKPARGTYTEPGDEEGLGGPDDGRSAVSGGPN